MAKKKKKKRKLKIKNILICFLGIIIFVGVIYYILMLPIKNIYITGNKILADSQVIDESGLSNYPSFLLTSSLKIKSRLLKNDYVKNIKIKKKIGNIIEINVVEYKAIALIGQSNKVILSSGKLVDNKYEITDVPILTNNLEKTIFNNFIKKFSNINTNILRQISQIEYSPVKVDSRRFLLYMDDGNIVYVTLTKLDKLNKYNDIKDKMGGQTGIIYLDSGDYIELKDTKVLENTEGANNN